MSFKIFFFYLLIYHIFYKKKENRYASCFFMQVNLIIWEKLSIQVASLSINFIFLTLQGIHWVLIPS